MIKQHCGRIGSSYPSDLPARDVAEIKIYLILSSSINDPFNQRNVRNPLIRHGYTEPGKEETKKKNRRTA